eukprot:168455_1
MTTLANIELINRTQNHDNDTPIHDKNIEITWSQIIGGSIGNILEWFDFAIFGYLASEIGYNFFHSSSNNHSIELLEAYGVFAGAFIMRPIGGVIFGMIGDAKGRKYALQLSMILMFIATFSIGCLPTQTTIGIWSPIILIILRLFQGVSVGGQLIGSILFIVESANPKKRGFYGGIAMATSMCGGISGSLFISIMDLIFTSEQMNSYAWRIPFLSSIIIGTFGFISQRNMEQSTEFLHASKHRKLHSNPVKKAVTNHWFTIILMSLAVIFWCAGGYMTFQFLPIFLQHEIGINNSLLVSTFMNIWVTFCVVFGGYLADRYNYYIIMKYCAILVMIWSAPAYYVMHQIFIINKHKTLWPLIISDMVTGFGIGIFGGAMQIFMVYSINDVIVRYSAIGIAYNICQSIFGGTAPLIGSALSLIKFYYVGIYISSVCLVSAIALQFMQWKTNKMLKRMPTKDEMQSMIENE